MDSMLDDNDPTLPIDFDQTGNFARFLDQTTRKDSMQSDTTFTDKISMPEYPDLKEKKKRRSLSTNDQLIERPHSRGTTLRDQENTIGDLKKECFGLKMRIYFMEEKLHSSFDASTEDILKKNIELKVTVEEIKQELRDKSELLAKASQAMEQLYIEKGEDFKEKYETELLNIRVEYESRLQEKDEELKNMENEMEKFKILKDEVDGEAKKIDSGVYVRLQDDIKDYQREIENFKTYMESKDTELKKLKGEKQKDEDCFKSMVRELEDSILLKESSIEALKKDIEKLAGSPERSNKHYKKLYERQSSEIAEKEKANTDLKTDLTSKTNLAENLKDRNEELEKIVKGLRTNLHEIEIDKQRNVGRLLEKLKQHETALEAKDRELDGQSQALAITKETLLKKDRKQIEGQLGVMKQNDEQIAQLTFKLKQQQFEIERLTTLIEEKDKEIVYFGKKSVEGEKLCEKLKEQSKSELTKMREGNASKFAKHQDKIETLQERFCQVEDEFRQQLRYKDKVIQSFADAVHLKDNMIERLVEVGRLEDSEEENGSAKDQLIAKVQKMLREKEKLIEKYKEHDFAELKKRDDEMNSLRKLLREKDHLLQKNEALLLTHQERAKNFESTNQSTLSLVDKLKSSLDESLAAEREAEFKASTALRKKDEDILKFNALSAVESKEVEALRTYLTSGGTSNELQDILSDQLKSKENEIQELRSLHEKLIASSSSKYQQLLSELRQKEQTIKDLYKGLRDGQQEKNDTLEALRLQLCDTDQQVKDLNETLLELKRSQNKKQQTSHEIINEKDLVIETLVKSGLDKDRLISDLKENTTIMRSASPNKSMEISKQQQAIEMLREELEKRNDEMKRLAHQNTSLQKQLNEENSAKNLHEDIEQQIGDLQDINRRLEDEKLGLQSELDLLKISKESLQNQLSRRGTPDYKESLIEELEDLVLAAEKEKERYEVLSEKLQNNMHPESCFKLLKNEIAEVEHLRRNLQSILLSALKKVPSQRVGDNARHNDVLVAENKKLKQELEDSEKLATSLQDQLAFSEKHLLNSSQLEDFQDLVSGAEKQNHSLKEDLKRCELEAKQLSTQLATTKLDYEQLVHERDREISKKTDRLDALRADNEILVKQRDQSKQDLLNCNRQLEALKLRVDGQDKKIDHEKEKQVLLLQKKMERNIEEFQEKEDTITTLSEENSILKNRLQEAEKDLRQLNENLQKMKDVDLVFLESKLTTASSAAHEEKRQLKKDIKGLISINDRLRNKLKDLTAAYERLMADKASEDSRLTSELQKAKNTVKGLENDLAKQHKTIGGLEQDMRQLRDTQLNTESSLTMNYQNALDENRLLRDKVDEFAKVTEFQKSVTETELNELRNEVLTLTKENSTLKLEKLEIESNKDDDNLELAENVSELKQCNTALQGELHTRHTQNKQLDDELTRSRELVDNLQVKLSMVTNDSESNQRQQKKLQIDFDELLNAKLSLEKQLKEFAKVKEKLASSAMEINAKNNCITSLQAQVDSLVTQLETFSPPHTSSLQNITLSSEAFTQTAENNTSDRTTLAQLQNSSKSIEEDNSLLALHIKEMRELRKQLEETRLNNDALRKQLEHRLLQVERDAMRLNDPQLKVTLIRDNDAMRAKLMESETSQEKMRLHMDELLAEKNVDKEAIANLHEQLHELNEISRTLKLEMEAYDRLVRQFGIERIREGETKSKDDMDSNLDKHLLVALLEEIRDLREQLTKSIEVNTALREKLEKEIGRPVSVSPLVTPSKDPNMSAKRSLFSAVLQSVSVNGAGEKDEPSSKHHGGKQRSLHFASPFETPTKDHDPLVASNRSLSSSFENTSRHELSSFSLDDRCVLLGKWSNYKSMTDKSPKLLAMMTSIQKKVLSAGKEQFRHSTFTLKDITEAYKLVKEMLRLVATFVPQEDKQSKLTEENIRLRKDLLRLKKVLASKEHFIKSALEMVEENSLWKENNREVELINKKLINARDTLKTTKGNLEEKVKRAKENASSLDSSFTTSFDNDTPSS